MPFNGSGGFDPVAAPAFPAVTGTTIVASYYNSVINDILTGLGQVITRGGQSPATANLPMAGFKHTGAGDATATGQYLVYGQSAASFGSLALALGSVGAPSLYFTGDTNNGWWSPAADEQAWSLVGVEAMRLNASGLRVTPQARIYSDTASLQFYNTANAVQSGYLQMNAAAAAQLRVAVNQALEFYTNNTLKLALTADGRFYGSALHNNAGAVTGTTNQYVGSGTYTPTLTNVLSINASTAYKCQWMRVGNVVTVSGRVDMTPNGPTMASGIQLGISLPIASNFSASEDCGGAIGIAQDTSWAMSVRGDATNDRAEIAGVPNSSNNRAYYFTFTYEVK